jgi:hypothetical protein
MDSRPALLRLTHVGRRSGRLYQTVSEVIGQNRARNEVIVVPGLGRSAHERRNRYLGPLIHSILSWLVGWRYDGTESARHRLAAELPLIGLRPAWAGERPASSEALADRHHLREAVTPPAR